MPRLLYTLLLCLLLPVVMLRHAFRGRAYPGARGHLWQRLGFGDRIDGAPLWLHCVSVGETAAAEPVIDALLADGERLLVTSTTFTGAERVAARYDGRLAHRYMPYDTPGAVARFLDRTRPRALVILETELWPNLLLACRARGIPVLLANARLSERSARRYARMPRLMQRVLAAFTVIAAQAPDDAERFRAIGAPADRVRVNGNLKFDIDVDASVVARAQALRAEIGARPVWVAASTHAGEEDAALAAHREVLHAFPDALLVIVPRHPERFEDVATLLAHAGLASVRRSRGEKPRPATAVWLGDTMGELSLFYAIADVAFVGGSLAPAGGHSLVEPASLGVPVLAGPNLFNCRQIADDLQGVGALDIVNGAPALAVKVTNLLASEPHRLAAARAGRDYVAGNRGACARLLELIRATSHP